MTNKIFLCTYSLYNCGCCYLLRYNIVTTNIEGFAPKKIIPLSKDVSISFEGHLYGENAKGQIKRIETEYELKDYKNKAAYLVAKNAVTNFHKDYLKKLFPDKKVTSEYNLNVFGRTLYTEFAKWDFSSFQELINFCKTWGLPTGVTVSVLETKIPENDINIIWMSLDDFYTKVYEYQRIFSYFKALNTNDFSKLPTTPKKRENIKAHAARILIEEIEKKSLFSYKIKIQEDITTPISIFSDLFEAAYFYLNLSINSSAEMRICENCRNLFEVTHQRQRFCAVLPGRKRSSCEMAYNNRLKKEKKQKGEI
ncbi:hypothetical protein [Cytobacillus kochii]